MPSKEIVSRHRPTGLILSILALVACFVFVGVGAAWNQTSQSSHADSIGPKGLAGLVQSFDKVKKEEFAWGWIRWMMSSKLDPKSEMTFGIVHLKADQINPFHVHANCEEHLYVLSGSCEHWIGKETIMLKKGDVIRIPAGVPHKARTFKEPMESIIVYSSGDRQFEVVEE
jgi:quercetin dioxygenase-like cupin family protein